jgi:hypothetical protein
VRQICILKLEGGNVEIHITEMTNLFQKFIDLEEEPMSNNWSIAMLLSSLPKSYDVLVTALGTKDDRQLDLGLVQSKIIAKYKS